MGTTIGRGTGNRPYDVYDKAETVSKAQLLTEIKKIDGAGSGLDADFLDGLDSTQFVRSDTMTLMNADLNMQGHTLRFNNGNYSVKMILQSDNNFVFYTPFHTLSFGTSVGESVLLDRQKIWTSGNDGAGSGLDADLVRGLPADFTSSKATNGYQKLPSGLIIQWGTYSNGTNGTYTVSLPIAFPNADLMVLGYSAVALALGADNFSGSAGKDTLSTIKITIDISLDTTWIAIGY